ncbi:chromosome segregation atpase family [Trichoderma cornu-damae]|uniref:Chromosome segregation atpase family n=1 Tax=Trichoderma cornu-damae TaxID=654480 RepID=A0A9P8QSW1_9HYPO|nr:chromosome segregation atpase family [Trichoderma cornu-damae]
MSYSERQGSFDGEPYLRHQHSGSSGQGIRGSIPISDPERAPPPLPLNPQSPKISSRASTSPYPVSSAIQSAHAALSERVRESNSAHVPPPVPKRINDPSPDRSIAKGAGPHRRLQSMQTGSVRDISLMLENASNSPNTSPTKPYDKPERLARPATPPGLRESGSFEARVYDREMNLSTSSLSSSLTPIVRPTVRRPAPQSILSENTPPQSSTMLALQSMPGGSPAKETEPPLSNITNGATTSGGKGATMDTLASQILSLTNIASSLQKEMAALSRRSRDNATDLLSLKEATNTRDEDIRKSLRDLLGNIHDQSAKVVARDSYNGYYLDNKPHPTSPNSGRTYQIPRVPSPKSFAESIDRASMSTPSLVGGDNSGATSILLLEKILRGLGTRDGQESLLGHLLELSEKLTGMATAAKVEELVDFVRLQNQSAMVPVSTSSGFASGHARRFSLDQEGVVPYGPSSAIAPRLLHNMGDARRPATSQGILNDDILNIIRSVKDSVAASGGLTAEVKALVRELRGEVLGMGRELGKRLENVGRKSGDNAGPSPSASKDEVSRVIDEGLEQMKEQLTHVLKEHRRQSQASAASQKLIIDYREIYAALRSALKDIDATKEMPDLNRDDVLEAVREAWENYKPEIEVQQIGLERDEILECLKQGLQEYESRNQMPPAATRDEVLTAVVEGLKHYVPPQMDTSASMSRDEIIEAVRECLEEFEFPVAPSALGNELTREDMLRAVKEGLNDLDLGKSNALVPVRNHDEISIKLHELMEFMKLELRAVSDEAKENMATSGRDAEQLLDATKDGLENLRSAIEGYVDRAAGVASQEDFLEGLLKTMEEFKEEVSALVSKANATSRQQLQTELEGLRDVVHSSMVPAAPLLAPSHNDELLDALRNGLSNLRQEILRPRPETSEILDALNDGLNDIRAGIDRITNKPVDLTANDEILDALKEGLDGVRSDIGTIRDSSNDRAIAIRTVGNDNNDEMAIIPADMAKHGDIKNLEILITQLRAKIEEIEPTTEAAAEPKVDLTHLEAMLRDVQKGVDELKARAPVVVQGAAAAAAAAAAGAAGAAATTKAREGSEQAKQDAEKPKEEEEYVMRSIPSIFTRSGGSPTREDVAAIENILRNTKSRVDHLIDGDQAVRREHIDTLESLILESREAIRSVNRQLEDIPNLFHKDDFAKLTSIITQLAEGLQDIKEHAEREAKSPEKVKKSDVHAVEAVVREIKTLVDGIAVADFATITTREDLSKLETMMKETKETFDNYHEASSKALVDRQSDISGVHDRIYEVKSFLEEFQTEIRNKLVDGSTGIEGIGRILKTIGDKVEKNENVAGDVKDMFEVMKSEFEISKEAIAGSRIESNEKLDEVTQSIRKKIDDKVNELLAKNEALRIMLDEKSQAAEAREIVTESAVTGTKVVADELKLLIDTLGSTVTDSLEKMEEASKIVFTKVEEMATRSEETHNEGKVDHQQTRDQIREAVGKVEGSVGEYQPQILEAVKSILGLVGDHFEHSKGIQEKVVGAIPTEQAFRAMMPEKYDDAVVHEKLDKIAQHNDAAAQAFLQLQTLEKVHQSVVETAAELSDFLSKQTKQMAEQRDSRARLLEETNIALERASTEREHVEASVRNLKEEEEWLRRSVLALRNEQEGLMKQKTRLTGDVSALETALRLRKEELHEMEHRAEGLERRIFNGVMDHSRVLLFGKKAKGGAESMNRKRVKKPAGDDGTSSPRGIATALSSARNPMAPSQTGTARRIASLSQMTNSVASNPITRSHSVKTPGVGADGHRKRSWGGTVQKSGLSQEDKENLKVGETVEELDEGDMVNVTHESAVDDAPGDGSEYEEEMEEEEEEEDDDDDDHDHDHDHDVERHHESDGTQRRRISKDSSAYDDDDGSESEYEESIDGDEEPHAAVVVR